LQETGRPVAEVGHFCENPERKGAIVKATDEFFNLYNHDMVRVAVAIPIIRVAAPAYNAEQTVALVREASARKASLVLFPELGLSAYTCDDLFQQRALLDGCLAAFGRVLDESCRSPLVAVVGLPLRVGNLLFNCAAAVAGGKVLGVVPKTYPPNYREFYELRQFAPATESFADTVEIPGYGTAPFGTRLLFRCDEQPLLTFSIEICEDLWVPVPPSSYAALAGATILLNLSASNITIGKADYRRSLVSSQSGRCLAAYLYSAAGVGESTTDLAWDGHALICENGNVLAESKRFQREPQLIVSEIDLERLAQERIRQTSFGQNARDELERHGRFRTIDFTLTLPRKGRLLPEREYERFPYVPSEPSRRDERCAEVYAIQVEGLATRMKATGIQRVVIGVSGGIDSTHALLVCAQAMDQLGYPRTNILAYTMPGFATSQRTLRQARALMHAIGCTAGEIDIRPAAELMLRTIGHPHREAAAVYDVTYENVQAGERTSHLFRLANLNNALVVGTGDLSELALGWCTFGVGDHMSHYSVNASVPKTLIQHVIRWVAERRHLGEAASAVLREILETPISPELVPEASDAEPAAATETAIGPYELQDFNLYYVLRFGYLPTKVAFLSYCAWRDRELGSWPDIAPERRNQYSIGEIKRFLRIFLERFFQFSQFKRSTIPNAPKVGSGGSLSPRGDWRAPSDSSAAVWLSQLELVPDESTGGQ
jgi:NAD+ synthase (glutamine-hydrolysing)